MRLSDGRAMPIAGFGVWQIPEDDVADAVRTALDVGYRLIDTAQGYGNEAGTGRGLRESGVPRSEVFLTTKLDAETFGSDEIVEAFERSLDLLGTDYVDAYLIHWPRPSVGRTVETWEVLRGIRDSGRARSIGVCNFEPAHLAQIVEATGEVPTINQIELHPWLQQAALRDTNSRNGIASQAWSPLGSGALLSDPRVVELARSAGLTPAEMIIGWHEAQGHSYIVKSITPERIRSNHSAQGVRLTQEQCQLLQGLDRGRRTGPHPDEF